ncbi:MAG: DUF6377 domain-containing protein [Mucilaginibacter sp.]
MKTFLLTLLLLLPGLSVLAADSLLDELKIEISRKKMYDDQKESRIKQLKLRLLPASSKNIYAEFSIYDQLYEEYKVYNFDSAYTCAQKLLLISRIKHDIAKQQESSMKMGFLFISAGMFKEGFDCLNQINTAYLNDSTKAKYYSLMSRAYGNLAEYNNDKYFTKSYLNLSGKYIDSAIALFKPYSYNWMTLQANKQILTGDINQPSPYLSQLLDHYPLDEHQRAMAACGLSYFYNGAENRQKNMELLAMAVINDIRSSTKETLAIFRLGQQLYLAGNVNDAYLCTEQAMNDAQFYGARLRKIKIGAVLPLIASQQLITAENEKNTYMIYFLLVVVVTILVSLVSFIVFIQLKKLKVKEKIIEENNAQLEVINEKLNENGRIKEQYIGYFVNVTSSYIVKLEKLKRSVERKIMARKFDDILISFNDINIKKERENLFYTFDHTFLAIFPNFINVFNSMLKMEHQIRPRDTEMMTTDLRIFALMRMGISDCETIASILEYSANTIYVYKMRVKAKAIVSGEQFDNVIMGIKAVSPHEPDFYRKSA